MKSPTQPLHPPPPQLLMALASPIQPHGTCSPPHLLASSWGVRLLKYQSNLKRQLLRISAWERGGGKTASMGGKDGNVDANVDVLIAA